MQRTRMQRMRDLLCGVTLLALTLAWTGCQDANSASSDAALAPGAVQAPRFEVDPLWPKPLPNHRIPGSATGVSLASPGHMRRLPRGPAQEESEAGRRAACYRGRRRP